MSPGGNVAEALRAAMNAARKAQNKDRTLVLGTILASALGVLLFAVLDEVVGQATVDVQRLPGIVAYVAILNGVLSRPFRWVLRRALADPTSSSRDRMFLR